MIIRARRSLRYPGKELRVTSGRTAKLNELPFISSTLRRESENKSPVYFERSSDSLIETIDKTQEFALLDSPPYSM